MFVTVPGMPDIVKSGTISPHRYNLASPDSGPRALCERECGPGSGLET